MKNCKHKLKEDRNIYFVKVYCETCGYIEYYRDKRYIEMALLEVIAECLKGVVNV